MVALLGEVPCIKAKRRRHVDLLGDPLWHQGTEVQAGAGLHP